MKARLEVEANTHETTRLVHLVQSHSSLNDKTGFNPWVPNLLVHVCSLKYKTRGFSLEMQSFRVRAGYWLDLEVPQKQTNT